MYRKSIYFFILLIKLCVTYSSIDKRSIDVRDRCVLYVGDVKVDLNKLFRSDGYEVRHEDRRFLLNICGNVKRCEINDIVDVAVCEISDKSKNKTILGLTNNVHSITIFKPNLGIRYTYQDQNKKKFITEIEFRCNLRIEDYKLTFVSKSIYGKRFNFIFESNFFCIKKPLNCLYRDEAEEFSYDLRPLYNKNDYKIHNTSTIILNICGNLTTNLTNECEDTQICLIEKNGIYKNLGRFAAKGIHYINTNYVTVIYTDGSVCDADRYIETQIDFKCSSGEKSPSVLFSSPCRYHIIWETYHACPHYNITYKNCEIQNHFYGDRNFNDLLKSTNEVNIKSSTLSYNVCSVLNTCDNYKNASICLKEGNEEKVYGWKNTDIFFNDGNLTMEYIGNKCDLDFFYSTRINFICSYSDNINNYAGFIHYPCRIFINYYTKAACSLLKINKKSCKINVDSKTYDLSALILLDNNYIIRDSENKNVDYLINICHPLVSDSNSLCDPYSAVCRRNHSEPDIRKKFNSLGSYNDEESELSFTNGYLRLKYIDGNFCKLDKKYSTEIKFVCGIDESVGPELIYHDECNYFFEWRTKYACLKPIVETIPKTYGKNHNLTDNNTVEHYILTTMSNKIIKNNGISPTDSKTESYMLNIKKSELIVQNCIITDKNNDLKFNFTYLPQNLQVTSKNGKTYSINICHKEQNKCQSTICGGLKYQQSFSDSEKLIMDIDKVLSEIKLKSSTQNICNEGYYNSMVIMKCAEKLEDPTVISENECSVQFEWYNNATCAFLDILPKIEKDSSVDTHIGLICGILLTLLGLALFTFFFWKKTLRKKFNDDKERVVVYYEKNTML